jgi:hypothetical protein
MAKRIPKTVADRVRDDAAAMFGPAAQMAGALAAAEDAAKPPFAAPPKVTAITICNVMDRAAGEAIIAALSPTYMDFTFGLCPVAGSLDLVATTSYVFDDGDNPEIVARDMLLSVLAGAIRRQETRETKIANPA